MWYFGYPRSVLTRHRGLRASIRDIAVRTIADSLLRASVNSAVTVLAIRDVASFGFYRHQISDLLSALGGAYTFFDDLPSIVKPYVSKDFQGSPTSEVAECLIALFARYYVTRLPVLCAQQWFSEIPRRVGFSEQDILGVVRVISMQIGELFPRASQQLEAGGPEDPKGLLQTTIAAIAMAKRNSIDSAVVQQFVVPREELVIRVSSLLSAPRTPSNVNTFVTAVLEQQLGPWWYQYRLYFKHTFQNWYWAGAFIGGSWDQSSALGPMSEEEPLDRAWLNRLKSAW